MNNFKKAVCFILLLLLVLSNLCIANAEDSIKVLINGKQLSFQVEPVIIQERTMVPLRAIFEALGAVVSWEGSTKTVTGIRGDTKVILQIDNNIALVNGKEVQLEVAGTLVNDSTMVPVRFIAESLGAKVGWDGNTRSVIIEQEIEQPVGILYKTQRDVEFSITTSRLVDTYFIVAGLYHDFNHSDVMPYTSERELYRYAKEYFTPYKDHKVVKEFSKFNIDTYAYIYLLNFSDLPDALKIHGTKPNNKNFDDMIGLLKQFYIDSRAEDFFKANKKIYDDLKLYIKNEAPIYKVEELINEIEAYTGNKYKYFTKRVAYSTNITFFKMIAPFYRIEDADKVTLATVAPAFKYSRGSDEFSVDSIITTAIHEALHQYLNTPVANNMQLINNLTANLKKEDFISPFYVARGMAWNRLIDENFVRAVEARIFDKIFGNSRGYNSIIEPQIKAGFKNLNKAYLKLEEYEKNRDKYTTIDDFMPELIESLFK